MLLAAALSMAMVSLPTKTDGCYHAAISYISRRETTKTFDIPKTILKNQTLYDIIFNDFVPNLMFRRKEEHNGCFL